jgi:integrase/recombinase XerC
MDNGSLMARFEQEHIDRHSISSQRRRVTLQTLKGLAERLEGRTLAELTPSDIMAWQAAELKRGLAPNTLRNRESMVRAFLTWALQAGVITFEQSARLKSVQPARGTRVKKPPKPYKRTEVIRLREQIAEKYPVAPVRGRGSLVVRRWLEGRAKYSAVVKRHARRLQLEAQVSLALEEGLRLHEIHHLTLDGLSPENAAVVVQTAKQKPGEVRYREVPWTAHSRARVKEWLEFRRQLPVKHASPWLALTSADPLAPQSYEWLRKCLRPYCWHRLRHTFATERLRAGMTLEKVQVMMGHAHLEQTLAYTEIVGSDVTTQAERSESEFARLIGLEAA